AEHEPEEALTLIAQDRVDLAVVYDFPPAMRVFDDRVEATPLWTARWGLGGPAADPAPAGEAVATIARYRDHEWIVNSRNDADELAGGNGGALSGTTPTEQAR